MATVSITIPDENLNDVIDTLCTRFNYSVDSGLTKGQFLRSRLAQWVKSEYKQQKAYEAGIAAANSSNTTVDGVAIV